MCLREKVSPYEGDPERNMSKQTVRGSLKAPALQSPSAWQSYYCLAVKLVVGLVILLCRADWELGKTRTSNTRESRPEKIYAKAW